MKKKTLSTFDLSQQLIDAGILSTQSKVNALRTIYRWMDEGRIIYPSNGRAHRRFTQEMINEIIYAFKPGGPRRWSVYDDR